MVSMQSIREEQPGDATRIHEITRWAFGQSMLGHHGEAELIDRLRESCPDAISLVAEDHNCLVGHILFTPVIIESAEQRTKGMGLAPMSVLPGFQRQGIGSKLVTSGLAELKGNQQPFVVVLGHPEYYSRFGFQTAAAHGVHCEFEGVPPDAFLILFLADAVKVAGVAKFRPEFSSLA